MHIFTLGYIIFGISIHIALILLRTFFEIFTICLAGLRSFQTNLRVVCYEYRSFEVRVCLMTVCFKLCVYMKLGISHT